MPLRGRPASGGRTNYCGTRAWPRPHRFITDMFCKYPTSLGAKLAEFVTQGCDSDQLQLMAVRFPALAADFTCFCAHIDKSVINRGRCADVHGRRPMRQDADNVRATAKGGSRGSGDGGRITRSAAAPDDR